VREWWEVDWSDYIREENNFAWITNRMAIGLEELAVNGKTEEVETIFKNEVATFAVVFQVRVQGIKLVDLGEGRIGTEPGGIVQFDRGIPFKSWKERFVKITEGLKAIRTHPACKFVAPTN